MDTQKEAQLLRSLYVEKLRNLSLKYDKAQTDLLQEYDDKLEKIEPGLSYDPDFSDIIDDI